MVVTITMLVQDRTEAATGSNQANNSLLEYLNQEEKMFLVKYLDAEKDASVVKSGQWGSPDILREL